MPGTQVITVTASNPASTVIVTHTIEIADVPINFLVAANDSPTLLGDPTILIGTVAAGTNVSYAWEFGDGSIGSGAVVTHTYPAVGTYKATVTASNGVGSQITQTVVEIVAVKVEPESYSVYLQVILRK